MNRQHASALPQRFLRLCRQNLRRPKVADSTGAELTGAGLLMRTLVMRRLLRAHVMDRDERYVGVLLPPSVGAVVTNAALALDRRVAVNLNYTASAEAVHAAIAQCGIRHVLTSRRLIERLPFKLEVNLVYGEDFPGWVAWQDKLIAAVTTWLTPVAWLNRWFGLDEIQPDDMLTVIFTSGTTGKPKGVMLTHRNVSSNVDAIDNVLDLRKDDVVLGILPFFHSFGYTVTLWTILATHLKGVYHYNPIDARQIGQLCRQHGVTILLATPTFLRPYLKRCAAEDFATVEVVFVGAEKLPTVLAEAFEEKFGVRPHEGYGCTELSPIASGNAPASRGPRAAKQGARAGTVGRPMPGVEAKVIDMVSGEELQRNTPGMLLIRGPNVMKGYLGQPEATAQVIRDGWYVTGDVAVIDADGFIRITDRLSRFSKIGGEMVPHLGVEEAIMKVLAGTNDVQPLAVTGVPDSRKGERLVIIHTGLGKPVDQVIKELNQAGLPPLWIPSPDSFIQVTELPVLGTGKLDLRKLKQLAMEANADA
jgi:acyl-[acyl-carrier-protein]-phospholipid O-acyltransferase/long-chain-fatty-acid--[acyl-carrier-protein] ligase